MAKILELDVNKEIDDINLGRPTENLEIYRLRLEDELRRVGAKRGLIEGS